MSFFDQPYYALTKTHMSRIGIWPEQPKYVRIIRLLTMFTMTMTLAGPTLIRLRATWRDINTILQDIPQMFIAIGIFVVVLRIIQNFDKIKLTFKYVEGHWEIFKNTSAVIVLDKYAERGRHFIVMYSIYLYSALALYLILFLSPMILDFVSPLNETRPKMYILINVEYGIDVDKYYWFILAHQYILTIMAVAMIVAMETMYFLLAVHACALFEVVGEVIATITLIAILDSIKIISEAKLNFLQDPEVFNLKLITSKYTANEENKIILHNDWNYKKICDCITAHEVAICFADLIESICSEIFGVVLGVTAIMIVFSGVQAMIHLKHPHVLIQLATYTSTQIFHLYINSIPGQELINHSQKVHTTVCDLDWHDMSVKAQKLLIPILIRSTKPSHLTARKVYVLSMESFGSTIRTVISYFTVFAQLI